MFSKRTPDDLSPNSIAEAIDRSSRNPILDLTESNPTHCGLHYPEGLLSPLGHSRSLDYEPFALGHPQARTTVARFLGSRWGRPVASDRVVLTASTSEAYSYLFKLLGNPGDSFLTPVPGYPLLEHLARLEAMEILPYPLRMEPGWPLDRPALQSLSVPGLRGIITVNPHNPTGTSLSPEDRNWLSAFCRQRSLVHISDEVFSDYGYEGSSAALRPEDPKGPLCFRMGGLSKSLGLPQLKLSWMVLEGPPGLVGDCLERLELIADTYLSVNTPIQLALEGILGFAPDFRNQLLERVLANRAFLVDRFKSTAGFQVWPAQGGWYALLEVTGQGPGDEALVLSLLEEKRVLVQPGAFYDFPRGCFLVLSLLPKPEVFRQGVLAMEDHLKNKISSR